jgi:hypothetical protein
LKAILRALARRRVGFTIAARRKRGFRIPAERWLAGHWSARAEQALSDSILGREGWIDQRNALAALRRAAGGAAPAELWNIFVLESWLQHDRQQRRDRAASSWGQRAAASPPQAVSS